MKWELAKLGVENKSEGWGSGDGSEMRRRNV